MPLTISVADVSLPPWERGLKQRRVAGQPIRALVLSLPPWERGLKPQPVYLERSPSVDLKPQCRRRTSLPPWERGLKLRMLKSVAL